jgi:hypothetical protein
MDGEKLRAWWFHKQALDGRLRGQSAEAILRQTGWARSVGGVGPYLTVFARGGVGRATVDASVANLEIHELPAARGCTYVVPAADFALALKVGQGFGDAEMKLAAKLGVTETEIQKLSSAVLKALAAGPRDTDEIRDAVGSAARSLGEEGKKKGLTTTLPLALGELQASGDIRRVPLNGRLDQQRYRYTLWKQNTLAGFKMSIEEAHVELARRYFAWIGPASMAEFQWFSALSVKANKAAVEPLHLVPVAEGDPRLMLPEDREKFEAFQVPKKPQYALVSGLDGISLLRRDLKGMLAPEDQHHVVPNEKGSATVSSIKDLPSHAILDRGRLIGLWEFDPAANSIVWISFQKADAALKKAVEAMEEYVRNDLGDARSFSLDSPKSRVPRLEGLRAWEGRSVTA